MPKRNVNEQHVPKKTNCTHRIKRKQSSFNFNVRAKFLIDHVFDNLCPMGGITMKWEKTQAEEEVACH